MQPELNQYDYGARFYDPVIARWNSVDPMAEKYYGQSVYTYSLDAPILLNDLDGRDFDPTGITTKNNARALKNLLSTKGGYNLIAKFMHKGQVINIMIGKETTTFTFDKEGANANDKLTITSEPHDVMDGANIHKNVTFPRTGYTDEFPKSDFSSRLGDDANYDVLKGVNYSVYLDNKSDEQQSTNSLAHELTVHVDPDLNRFEDVKERRIDGSLMPGTAEYLNQLNTIEKSGNFDHHNLGQGRNTEFKNISAQLDKLKHSSQYSDLYNEEVKKFK